MKISVKMFTLLTTHILVLQLVQSSLLTELSYVCFF